MPNTFFIGDTHFGHTNILKFIPDHRPFKTIEEHDEALVERWNSVVTPDDRVFHLGDVYFGTSLPSYLGLLNGRITLIAGNHDTLMKLDSIKRDLPNWEVVGCYEWKGHILTHISVHKDIPGVTVRYASNIHGHLHDVFMSEVGDPGVPDPWYWNVSAEQNNLTPISYEELCKKYA